MKTDLELGLRDWKVARRKKSGMASHQQSPSTDIFTVAIEGNGSEPCQALLDWTHGPTVHRHLSYSAENEWLAERAWSALIMLRECVEVNPLKRGGVPVLRGTRFPVSHVFAELSDGLSIDQLASDFGLDRDLLKRLLEGLSIHLDRPFAK